MARDLISLLKASGIASPTTHDFDTYVPGSNAGTGMIDYILTDWNNWASSNYTYNAQYANYATLDFTFDFNAGSAFPHIRSVNVPTPASLLIELNGGGDAAGSSVTTVAGANSVWDVSGTNAGSTVRVQLLGPTATYGTTITGIAKNWFKYYDQGSNEIPMDGYNYDYNPHEWVIEPIQSGAPGGTTYGTVTFRFQMNPDAGGFNSTTLFSPTFTVQLPYRYTVASLEYQWAWDSAFSSVVSTAQTLEFYSDVNFNYGTAYLRYRVAGTSTWTNYNNNAGILFDDPRW